MARKRKLTGRNARQVSSAHQSPGIETLVPEIRSDVKWKPTLGAPAPFTVPTTPPAVVAVWNYGVPFNEMDTLNTWLRANEMALAGQLTSAMAAKGSSDPKVFYLGTYLNIDAGTPMYQTFWGYTSEEAVDQETAWPNPFPSALRDLIVELRAFWTRDPGRSETRFGFASNYANLGTMPNNPVMLQITIDAAT